MNAGGRPGKAADLDAQTFERLVAAHQAELYRYLLYLGAGPARAEDLVQDTFLQMWMQPVPPFFDDRRRRRGWLRGIARNLFLRHWEYSARQPVPLDRPALERAESVWATTLGDDGTAYRDALRACLEQLSRRNREILDLRYRDGKSRAEMAAALAIGEDGVKSALRRVRKRLQDCIEQRLKRGEA
jgi:RNA polymerase sigma-70 factor (ECF subfamily)